MSNSVKQTIQKGLPLIDFCIQYTQEVIRTIRAGNTIITIPEPCVKIEGPIKGHLHDTINEIFIQVSGSCEMEFPEEIVELRPGKICIIPKSTPHFETVNSTEDPFFNIVITFEQNTLAFHSAVESPQAKGRPSIYEGHRFYCNSASNACTYLDDLIYYHLKNTDTAAVTCQGLALSLFSIFALILETQEPDRGSEHPKIYRCRDIVKSNISNSELNVTELAQRIGCSADYLSYLFHKETGYTLKSYIIKHRIDKAKELIKDSSHQICEIGWYCGFTDPSYFIRVFKKQTGVTPKQYREKSA